MDKNSQSPTVFDTDQQQLGETYAKALLGLSDKPKKVDTYVDQLSNVAQVVSELPKLKAILESPQIGADQKAKLIEKSFGGLNKKVINFLKVLTRNGRFNCLAATAVSAEKLRDEAAGRVQGELTTASEVDKKVIDRIAERLSKVVGREVKLTSRVDADVIGGMVIRIGDTVYDGSVVNQLAQVRTKAVQKAADAIREKLDRFASSN
ncbi:ATP synthase F1 subunit delta [Mariniblastus sp.]|nr:ATP synthase F1 subunit delta [Mariniblastus sp.]